MNLRKHTLTLQRFEQSACEKAGLRLRVIDEKALLKDGKGYAKGMAETILADITDEVKAAAELGIELGAAIVNAKAKA